jgi:hypothetical protein
MSARTRLGSPSAGKRCRSARSNRSAADYPRTIPRRRPGHAGKTPLIHGSA